MFNVASDVLFWYPKQKAWQSAGVTSESEVRMRTNKQTQDIAWKVDDEKERAVILCCHVRDRRDCRLQSAGTEADGSKIVGEVQDQNNESF
jgi:hypothetical protein